MKKPATILLLLGAASVAILSFGQGAPGGKTPADGGVEGLRNEVAELRARVQKLEERTKQLEATVERLSPPPHPMPLIRPQKGPLLFKSPPNDSAPPEIWGEKKVNGWTVYLVPCEQKSP